MVPDERRPLILRAARDLFSQRPYADVSVADIARAAGVSPPLIVFHYGSKRSLYLAVLGAAAGAIRVGLRELPGPPSLDRLRAGVVFYAEYARTHRAGFLSLLRGGQDVAEAAALVEEFRDELAGQIHADLTAPRRVPADPSGPGAAAAPADPARRAVPRPPRARSRCWPCGVTWGTSTRSSCTGSPCPRTSGTASPPP